MHWRNCTAGVIPEEPSPNLIVLCHTYGCVEYNSMIVCRTCAWTLLRMNISPAMINYSKVLGFLCLLY